ncbi:MAG: hypothetical protein E7382_05480 [Clostridiales bacterium]|nr:hypothetical protein [Clostridiales bacterium]
MTKKERKAADREPVGRTVQTRDEFFEEQETYRKPGYENKGNYRKSVVVDSHNGDLILVKLTMNSPKGESLEDEKKSKYKKNTHVETKDDEGNRIRFGKKFIKNSRKKNLSNRDVAIIKKAAFSGESNRAKNNRNKAREIKGRPKI